MNDDLISRAAAIDILDAYQVMVENGEENPYAWARLRMSELPSAQPEKRTEECTETHSCDLISRKMVLALPRNKVRSLRTYEVVEETINVTDIEHLPSAQPEQRWIPCDKGEPDEDMECWVTVKTTDALYRGNFTKRFGKGFVTSGGFMWWSTALAWMPIYEPEPYRTEGDDNHEG